MKWPARITASKTSIVWSSFRSLLGFHFGELSIRLEGTGSEPLAADENVGSGVSFAEVVAEYYRVQDVDSVVVVYVGVGAPGGFAWFAVEGVA